MAGVDYEMSGGAFTFRGGAVPTSRNVSLEVLPDALPKSKTRVIKLVPGNSVTPMGPITTFNYTITNP